MSVGHAIYTWLFIFKTFNSLPKNVVFPFLLDEKTAGLVGILQYGEGESTLSRIFLMPSTSRRITLQVLVTVKVNAVLKSCLIFTVV